MSDRLPPLTPGARAVVDAARSGDEPGAGDRERVRAKVLAAIAAGGAAGAGAAGHASAATSAGSATAGGALAAKLAMIAIAVAGVATGAYLALRSPDRAAEQMPAPSVSALPPEPQPEPEVAPAITADAAIEMGPEDVPDPSPAKPRATKKKDPAPTLSPADSLREERALIARASDALRDGDAAAALTAVKEHQRRFPDGMLIEERSAARVQALCALGRTADGTSAREAFLARWPRSVHAAKVRVACAP
jgi:hypothetical protein